MSTAKKTHGMILASAAAALLAGAPVNSSASETKLDEVGKCWGVNSCKGSSNCKTLTSACAGKNACKSQGFLNLEFRECNELGGDFESLNKNR